MNWKMFELGERLGSTEEGVFKVFNSIRALGIRGVNASSDDKEESIRPKSAEAFIIASRRKNEVETQKAMLASMSRHDRWKAGGPL